MKVSLERSGGNPLSVISTVTENDPESANPGEQSSEPLPSPLSVSAQNPGSPDVLKTSKSPSGSVADNPTVRV